jgi:small subunit ribosomal protein S7
MTRKKRDHKRPVLPDPKFGEIAITRFVNVIMQSGKKNIAERALYSAFDLMQKKTNENPLELFHKAISNVRPMVEVRSRRVGGANYQIPTEVPADRSQSLALRWLIAAANERGERSVDERLAAELLDAAQNRGGAVKKREDTHRMADANKAFAHFKW